jgi:very-short-patch-repair endonuclease
MVFRKRNIDFLLYLNTEQKTRKFARYLRKKETKAEKKLWELLKSRRCEGLKFRRQHPIHYYVVDFYCHKERLIVEVDGGIHSNKYIKEHDENRTAELERYGIRILRFSNEEVINNTAEVVTKIKEFVMRHPFK